ncbi:MAG: AAA family ATPase [Deltaproteobacteria bacterium]|nr:AAA family ATPase [Deltaproteobacteria bacterium]
MKILKLDLKAFGPFTEKVLDFSEKSDGLHLIYGDNEAGKSSSLRGLIAWLFGISHNTADNFIHGNKQLRIGGIIQNSAGDVLEFVRRKGNSKTILDPTSESSLDDSILTGFLPSGVDETVFSKLYGIDYNTLVSGSSELLEQNGDIGRALFSASFGTDTLKDVLDKLRKSAEELYKPRGSNQKISVVFKQFVQAEKDAKSNLLTLSEWKRLISEEKRLSKEISSVEKDIDSIMVELNKLKRIKRVNPVLAQLKNLNLKLEFLENIKILPDDFAVEFEKLRAERTHSEEFIQKNTIKLLSEEKEYTELNVNDELLKNEIEIRELFSQLGAVRKSVSDLGTQQGKMRTLKNEAVTLLKGVRPDVSFDECEKLSPLLNNGKWIHSLVSQKGVITERINKSLSEITEIREQIGRIKSQKPLEVMDEKLFEELTSVIRSVRNKSDIQNQLNQLIASTDEMEKKCEHDMGRLGRFNGTLKELASIRTIEIETLNRYEQVFEEVNTLIQSENRKKQEMKEKLDEASRELNELLHSEDIPSPEDLKNARIRRDDKWIALRNAVENKTVETPIGDLSKPMSEYEVLVQKADEISDLLREENDRVFRKLELEKSIRTIASRIEEYEKTLSGEKRKSELLKEWNELWLGYSINPGTPREMQQWNYKMEALVNAFYTLEKSRRELRKVLEEHNKYVDSMTSVLARINPGFEKGERCLDDLREVCEMQIGRHQDIIRKKEINEVKLKELIEKESVVSGKHLTSVSEMKTWSEEWNRAIEGLGLEDNAATEKAVETFDQLVSFFDKYNQLSEVKRRIWGMNKDRQEFEELVTDFIEKKNIQVAVSDPLVIAQQLNDELNQAREDLSKATKIDKAIRELKTEIKTSEIILENCSKGIKRLMKNAATASEGEVIEKIEKSKEKRSILSDVERLEEELTRSGDGMAVSQLDDEVSGFDIDMLESKREQIEYKLKDMQKNRDTLRGDYTLITSSIKSKDGSDKSASSEQEAQEYLSELYELTGDYLRQMMAAKILETSIEEYRKKNQAPVLSRAGEIFSKLTLNSFVSLRDDITSDGKLFLSGVRRDNSEVNVNSMSDGTRDQLFLALRLATMENQMRVSEAVPLIVDDILIGFDDRRTRVCLDILSELSEKTQILLFTHHHRVVELAEKMDTKSTTVHYL